MKIGIVGAGISGVTTAYYSSKHNVEIDLIESRKIETTLFAKFGNKIFGFIILLYIFLIFSIKKLRNE